MGNVSEKKCRIVIVIPTLDEARGEEVGRLALAASGCSVPVRVMVVYDEHKQGFTKTVNRGIRGVTFGEDICLLNDDVEKFQTGWLGALRRALYSNSKYGLCGPSGMRSAPAPVNGERREGDDVRVIKQISFWCVLLKRDMIEEVGLLDESFIHYGSDGWYCHLARQKGWLCVRAMTAYLEHQHHGSGEEREWREHDRRLLHRWRRMSRQATQGLRGKGKGKGGYARAEKRRKAAQQGKCV